MLHHSTVPNPNFFLTDGVMASPADPWQGWAPAAHTQAVQNGNSSQRSGMISGRFHDLDCSTYRSSSWHPQVEENLSNLTSQSASVAGGDGGSISSGDMYMGSNLPTIHTSSAAYKRKRSLPGNPDPEAEVVALSPKTLMATNRFICEICNKGFQRDQNLQLHRRGHNLPWKLRQRSGKDLRKRVYVCPEPGCVHHDPARALGDLTGIKKHFCRKHGEKKYKCDKCGKKYAVQSDWKAHCKTCGTREYRCDCGTLFSRRDSFITHRAFCDALAEESARVSAAKAAAEAQAQAQAQQDAVSGNISASTSSQSFLQSSHHDLGEICAAAAKDIGSSETTGQWSAAAASTGLSLWSTEQDRNLNLVSGMNVESYNQRNGLMGSSSSASELVSGYESSALPTSCSSLSLGPQCTTAATSVNNALFSTRLSSTTSCPSAQMSATALLLKASQLGATSSNLSAMKPAGLMDSTSTASLASNNVNNMNSSITWQGVLRAGDELSDVAFTGSNLAAHAPRVGSDDENANVRRGCAGAGRGSTSSSLREERASFTVHDFLGVGQKEFATFTTTTLTSSGVV